MFWKETQRTERRAAAKGESRGTKSLWRGLGRAALPGAGRARRSPAHLSQQKVPPRKLPRARIKIRAGQGIQVCATPARVIPTFERARFRSRKALQAAACGRSGRNRRKLKMERQNRSQRVACDSSTTHYPRPETPTQESRSYHSSADSVNPSAAAIGRRHRRPAAIGRRHCRQIRSPASHPAGRAIILRTQTNPSATQ